jgi:hypothetical protein
MKVSILIVIFVSTATAQLPTVDQPFPMDFPLNRNGRNQHPNEPNRNCTILEFELNLPWKEIRLPHVYDCTRFYECEEKILVEKQCSDRKRTRYDPFHKICEWNHIVKCINYGDYNELLHGHDIVTPEECGK